MKPQKLLLPAVLALLAAGAFAADDELPATPPDAKPGECYAKVIIPARYELRKEEVVVKEPAERIEVIPARYEWVEEKIQVSEPSYRLVPQPARYETVTEKVEVRPKRRVWMIRTPGRQVKVAGPSLLAYAKAAGLPADEADPGQCFVEYYQPAQYRTETQQVLKRDAGEVIEVIPAKYEWVEEKVLVKEASKKVVQEPPVYETVTERVLVEPEKTVWKKGRGPVERIDNTTGEILCLVKVPAKYKTITKRVLKKPATTRTVEIPAVYKTVKVRRMVEPPKEVRKEVPAEYQTVTKRIKVADEKVAWFPKGASDVTGRPTGNELCLKEEPPVYRTITKRVLKSPATTKKVEIPAKFKTVKVQRMVEPPRQKRIEIPGETRTITRRVKVADERLAWRPILCQTNMTPDLVKRIQRALKAAGFDPGPIDGVVGRETLAAIDRYQRAKGLARGGLTMATIESLGVTL